MRALLRFLSRLALVLVALVAVAVGAAFLALPGTNGKLRVSGLGEAVEIAWDERGVPLVRAANEHDAYFGLGYVHAQDRLWQMEYLRRIGAGRLSEVFGARTLSTDRFIRTLGLHRLAEASLEHLDPPVLAALDAYAAGVNAWIDGHRWSLPPEFALLAYRPEPWRPADSLVWGRLMGIQLSGNWREELLRVRLNKRLPAEKLADLWPGYPPGAPTTIALADAVAERLLAATPEAAMPRLASNVWALAGEHTATGKPILANDPHLAFDAPVLWYLARIEAPGLSLAGGTVPGVPFHIIGHNDRIAWGITTTHSDLMDLFLEQPAGDGRYLAPDGPRPFEERLEVIEVRRGDPVGLTVRATRHGPVLSDVLGDVGEGNLVALASATLVADDRSAQALYKLNRAGDWPAFVAALSDFHSPQQNFAYADVAGDIGFYVPGRVPIRTAGDGTLPRPGWSSEYDWAGWVPFERLPALFNPPSGRIVNANNKVVPEDYPYLLAAHWPEPYRAERIAAELDANGRFDLTATAALQNDAVSQMARDFKALMLDLKPVDERGRTALALLVEWDGRMARVRPEPLIFQTWLLRFQQAMIADDLGPLAGSFELARPLFLRRAIEERPEWCDDTRTERRESCADLLAETFHETVAELAGRYGPDPAAWRWGDAHGAVFEHGFLRNLPILGPLSRLAVATDGGDFTINRGTFLPAAGAPFAFRHVHGAGLRAIFDLEDLSRSRFMIATGQSGNPLAQHYGDLMEAWRDGRYLGLADPPPAGGLTLEPAR